MNKWYMNNPKSTIENKTHKIFWNFKIETDLQILARTTRPSDSQQKEEDLPNS